MKAIFVADAHLKRSQDPSYRTLMRFLGRLRAAGPGSGAVGGGGEPPSSSTIAVTDLFLVGDMFDFWFSRKGRIYPEFNELIGQLKILKTQGVAVHLCEGNHDFSLKAYFSDELGMNVYEDWAVIERDGRKILVGHGDLVDRTNRRYLKLRAFLRSPFISCLQRLLPLPALWRIARWSSDMSKELMDGGDGRIAEAMHLFARDKFQEGFDAVILGHCHRAQLTEHMVGGECRFFATLGDWLRHDSFLYYNEGIFILGSQQ